MHWNQLESLIHDTSMRYRRSEIESLSTEILSNIQEKTKPLEAARMAYALTLLQLKAKRLDENKVLKFFHHLRKILIHEIQVSESSSDKFSKDHVIYVREMAEQYFSHIMMISKIVRANDVEYLAKQLRKKNHEKLLKLNNSFDIIWKRERQLIEKMLVKHYVFSGLLFSLAIFFSWTSFWSILDFGVDKWVFTEISVETIAGISQQGLLLFFSLVFLFIFLKNNVIKDELGSDDL